MSVDGASMSTHVPHWIGRALMAADEAESVGLLRMLACGSDATPEPEGGRGAFGALVARGMSVADAHDLVVELARLDRSAAVARLAASGLDESARRDVLRATHCDPPPLYLVLSTREIDSPAWAFLARWKDEWAIHDDDYVRNAGAHSFLTRVPVSCAPAGEGDLFCPLRIRTPTELFRGFLYRPADAADGQFSLDTSRPAARSGEHDRHRAGARSARSTPNANRTHPACSSTPTADGSSSRPRSSCARRSRD